MTALDICVDVSDNNSDIDWPAVYAAGIRIAFVKVMEYPQHGYPSGPVQIRGASAAGVITIPYWFMRPLLGAPAIDAAAKEFAKRAELGPDKRFMLDWEGRASQTCTAAAAEAAGEQLSAITGLPPVGYWGLPGSTPAKPTMKMMGWARLVPRYPQQDAPSWADLSAGIRMHLPRYWGTPAGTLPAFAQYTAWGRVDGIEGDVDRSVAFFADEAAAIAWARGK